MSRLHELFERGGQSPWLDNLKRGYITSGELQRWVDRGIRGITSNPSIFQKAISGGADYEAQFRALLKSGASIEDSYWQLVSKDIADALAILRPVYDDSNGVDGFVSIEVDPTLARDTDGHDQGGAPVSFHDRAAEPLRQDPRDRRRSAGDPADDRRRPQYQRHVDLQPRPLSSR